MATPILVSGSSGSSTPTVDLDKEIPQDEAGWEQVLKRLRDDVKVASQDDSPMGSRGLQIAQHALRNAMNAKQLQAMERERAQVPAAASEQ
ncbi:MAG: hypothetical protein M3Q73_01365 [bacterium]|nr:hypothetical protein [bacterium]